MKFLQNTPLVITLACWFRICKTEMEPFVVGGIRASILDYPHCIYLAIDCSSQWICGASVLNQDVLLTAAHCISACNTYNVDHLVEAFAGHENLEKNLVLQCDDICTTTTIVKWKDWEGDYLPSQLIEVRSKREVGEIKIHEAYDEHTAANDIGLAALKKSLYLGHNIKRIAIRPRFPDVQRGQVAGWGIVDEEILETATILKSVGQKIRSKRVCSQIGILEPGMFCAGSTKDESHHPADGDSGSALITKDFTQLGLVSFRSRKLPALMVYTNTSYYYKWIKKNARILYCRLSERYLKTAKLRNNNCR